MKNLLKFTNSPNSGPTSQVKGRVLHETALASDPSLKPRGSPGTCPSHKLAANSGLPTTPSVSVIHSKNSENSGDPHDNGFFTAERDTNKDQLAKRGIGEVWEGCRAQLRIQSGYVTLLSHWCAQSAKYCPPASSPAWGFVTPALPRGLGR